MNVRHVKPLIIPFFLRNRGCRHRCVFCNERIIAGNAAPVTEALLRETAAAYLAGSGDRRGQAEIAFYGGSFTAMPREEQMELLRMAGALIAEGAARTIRVSTRPDELDGDWLRTLREMGVRTVEIGAQSMNDALLRESGRGHTAGDVRRAVGLLKGMGFRTGVHLMAGLPGESLKTFEDGVTEIIGLRPNTVRIHPVLVFGGTELAERYESGLYRPLGLDEAVAWCKRALSRFTRAGIPVIRLGLQATGEMEKEGSILAGPWHPAFRGLVEAALFRDMALELVAKAGGIESGAVFHVAPADMSNFNGMDGSNRDCIEARFGSGAAAVKADPSLQRGTLRLLDGRGEYGTSIAEVCVV